MSTPNEGQQLEIAELATEMERDPLSKALWENAQYRVLTRKLQAQNELLKDRVSELEGQAQARKKPDEK